MKTPVAIFTSDIHLRDRRPSCRGEENWLEYQKSILLWLNDLCLDKKVPLVIAGDIFDQWKHTSELVNMAIDSLPYSYCVSGNHDVKSHSRELENKSAYGSFIRSDKIMELNEPIEIADGMTIYPFHFGESYYDCPKKDGFNILVGHELIWEGTAPFEGAPQEGNVENIIDRAKGYDLYAFGDNHKYFYTSVGNSKVLNNGSLFRLTADQIDYQPFVHILYSDGSIEHVEVPTECDKISRDHLDSKKDVENKIQSFTNNLKKREEKSKLSFEDRIRNVIVENRIEVEVEEIINECMEND